ncbi:MAG TPA: quercetin 2,3-dioxygenase [Ilumatobacteraceae bacterium]|nr:quercetin 2,3-dioxygenase [Ilumatobacteraceae bacterium]
MTAETIDTRFDDRLRWFVGSLNRVVATAEETGGAFGLMEQWARRGFAPPMHVHHREDSALYVLDGTLRLRVGDEESTVTSGRFVFLPRDVPHSFRVDSEDAHFLELVTPGGFEQYHVDASDPAEAATLPPEGAPDILRLLSAIGPYDAEIIGPPL